MPCLPLLQSTSRFTKHIEIETFEMTILKITEHYEINN